MAVIGKPFQTGNPGRPVGAKGWDVKFRQAVLNAAENIGERIQEKRGESKDRHRAMEVFLTVLVEAAAKKEPGNLLRTLTSLLPKEIRAEFMAPLLVKYKSMNGNDGNGNSGSGTDAGSGSAPAAKAGGVPSGD